jgi:hypothetical protein
MPPGDSYISLWEKKILSSLPHMDFISPLWLRITDFNHKTVNSSGILIGVNYY